MLQHPRLGVGAIEDGDLRRRHAVAHQFADFFDDKTRLVEIGPGLKGADRLAFAGVGPQVLAETIAVVLDDGVGGGKDVAVRTVVLLQPDDVVATIVALEFAHVADLGTTEAVNRLVVVTDGKHLGAAAGQQLQPGVLQAVGVLELINQDMAEALLVVRAQRLVALQQLVAAQQQFGKITHALAVALRLVLGVDIDALLRVVVVHLGLRGADALLLVGIDEMAQLARRVFLVVDIQVLQQALDHRQLVGGIEDLEALRQPDLAVVGPQQAVAQPVKGADPHAADVDRHQRRQPRCHFLGRLVGKCHRQHPVRPDLAGGNQPGNAGGQHPRLAAACTGKNQGVHGGQRHGLQLRRIEFGEEIRHELIHEKLLRKA